MSKIPVNVPVSYQPKMLRCVNDTNAPACIKSLRFDPPLPPGSLIQDIREPSRRSLMASGASFYAEILPRLENFATLMPDETLVVQIAVKPPYDGHLVCQFQPFQKLPETNLLSFGWRSQIDGGRIMAILASDEGAKLLKGPRPYLRITNSLSKDMSSQLVPLTSPPDQGPIAPETPLNVAAGDVLEFSDGEVTFGQNFGEAHFVALLGRDAPTGGSFGALRGPNK